MPEPVQALLDRICEMIRKRIDIRRLADARRRHADVLAGRTTDYLPISFNAPVPTECDNWPRFGWDERFYDPDKSLFMQLRDLVLPFVGNCDACVGVRGDCTRHTRRSRACVA